ncbi:MAG: glycosyltransferase family 4 protein [Chitinophagaceae bacterium]
MPYRTLGIICTSQGWGELEISTLRLCEGLRERGWRVHLLSAPNAALSEKAKDIPNSVATLGSKNIPKKAKQLRLINHWVMQHKIEVLLLTNYKDIAIASLYKRFLDRDIALVYFQYQKLEKSKRDFIHTLRFKMIDRWVVSSEFLKAETLRQTRVPERKIVVIPSLEGGSPLETAKSESAMEQSGLVNSNEQTIDRMFAILEEAINAPEELDFLESLKD